MLAVGLRGVPLLLACHTGGEFDLLRPADARIVVLTTSPPPALPLPASCHDLGAGVHLIASATSVLNDLAVVAALLWGQE